MKALRKDFYVQLKKTINRFISLLLIVTLGVAFYTGIRSSEPDMRVSADKIYDDGNMMDIRIVSELGVTDDDVNAVREVEGIDQAEGSYNIDTIANCALSEFTARFMDYSAKINVPNMVDGNLPQKDNQCIVDTQAAEKYHLKIGDTITVKNENLSGQEYEITGTFTLGTYLSRSKGSSTVGAGEVNGLVLVHKNQFQMDCYTDIYAIVQGAKELGCYSDAYKKKVSKVVKKIEDNIAVSCQQRRYEDAVKEPEKELQKAQNTLDEKKKDYNDGVKALKKAKKEIKEQDKKILDTEKEIAANERTLKEADSEYADGYAKYRQGKKEYTSGKAKYEKGYKEYAKGLKEYKQGIKEYNQGKKTIEKNETTYLKGVKEYETAEENYKKMCSVVGETALSGMKAELDKNKAALDMAKTEIDKGKKQLSQSKKQLEKAKRKLDTSEKKLTKTKQELDIAKSQLDETYEQLVRAKKEIDDGYQSLDDGKQQVQEGKQKLQNARIEIKNNRKQLKKAKAELDKAQKKIDDNRKDLEKVGDGKWYVLDRDYIQTYVEFDQDASRVGNIGKVVPIIFFLVAAMVSLTTMTRMVEEERVQIGTMKALGYDKIQIAGKYLAYGGLAVVLGSILGGVIGVKVIPYIIINAYKMLYCNLYRILLPINIEQYLIAVAGALISVIGATILSCHSTLKAEPAELMRPMAPKAGKRVFLERIPMIWKHISFNMKSTFRNLFRYKKRLFMTLFGISGCMSLLLVGFGVDHSVNSILTIQYDEVFHYDAIITYDENFIEDHGTTSATKRFENSGKIDNYIEINQFSRDVGYDNQALSTFIIVPDKTEEINQFIDFRSRISDEHYDLNDNGVLITEKLSKELGVKVGDEIYIKESDTEMHYVKISAIVENYCYHYMYMTENTYKAIYGKESKVNTAMIQMKEKRTSDHALAEQLLKDKSIAGVSYTAETYDRFSQMMGSMDAIVGVLIISAGLLAFVVLYNLNNINIAERRRELATLKVLGFYDGEVSGYIYRENIMITALGIVLGIIFGYFLHQYVIQVAEINLVMFGRHIGVKGYVYSIIITIVFAVLINLSMHFKLKKVDMATSLKSGE